MCEYFDVEEKGSDDSCLVDLLPQLKNMDHKSPVIPHKATWRVVESPRRLMKTYVFDSQRELALFVGDILDFQEEFNHHAKITINYPDVIIEVYTHEVDDITELDKEYAQTADAIKKNIVTEQNFEFEGHYTEY